MARIIWSPEALGSLDLIANYLAQFDLDAARAIPQQLIETGNSLEDFPLRGRLAEGGWRELVTRPYVIRYDSDGQTVEILTIRHMAQGE